jgi:hypothetical protein
MFAGDVREQLGDPICDDCGRRLEGGVCPSCSVAPPAFEYEPESDSVGVEPATPDAEPLIQQVTWKKPDTADFADGLLQAVGWFQVFIAIFIGFVFVGRIASPRFHDDNAMGAAANALEQLLFLFGVWLNMFGAFAFFGYASLRRIRNAITPDTPQRYFR